MVKLNSLILIMSHLQPYLAPQKLKDLKPEIVFPFTLHTSSEAEDVYSACAGLGTESPAPGKDTLDRRLFLTPLQLFGILKAHRLW